MKKEGRIQGFVDEKVEREFKIKFHEKAAEVNRQGGDLKIGEFLEEVIVAGLKVIK